MSQQHRARSSLGTRSSNDGQHSNRPGIVLVLHNWKLHQRKPSQNLDKVLAFFTKTANVLRLAQVRHPCLVFKVW